MTFHLVFAIVWLGVAVAAFLLPYLRPDLPPWTILDTGISVGWAALFLGVYFLLRWWTTRRWQK